VAADDALELERGGIAEAVERKSAQGGEAEERREEKVVVMVVQMREGERAV
jgi:hypothetical protein